MTSQTYQTMRIPTAAPAESSTFSKTSRRTRTLDLNELANPEADLRSLQVSDPFMFHSIPEVHRARIANRDVDFAKLIANTTTSSASGDESSTSCGSSSKSSIQRRSRVSTECHVSMLLEELLDMDDDEFDSSFSDSLSSFDLHQDQQEDEEELVHEDLVDMLSRLSSGVSNQSHQEESIAQ